MLLIWLSVCFIFGVYIGSIFGFPLWFLFMSVVPLILIPVFKAHKTILVLLCFCMLTFISGNLCLQSSLPVVDAKYLQYYNDSNKSEFEGFIITEPEAVDRTLSFQFAVNKICSDNQTSEISGRAIVRAPRYSEYHYGDLLRIVGKLETPPVFEDFNYKEHLAHLGICSIINFPKIEVLQTNMGSPFLSFIYSLRNRLSQSLTLILPEPHCSLARGMLLGLRGSIPDNLTQSLANTGTTHIIAISGLNLSIIIGVLLSIGVWLFGRRYSLSIWLAFIAIWLYVLISGMQPPVIRGAIMGSMFLLAGLLGRQRDGSTALIFAAAIMVLIEPQVLWNVSFQLSFLSMAGLILILPPFQSWCRNKIGNPSSSHNYISSLHNITLDCLCVTIVAILATAPIIALNFGTFSIIALPANFFSVPSLPPIIITTALLSATGIIMPILAQFLSGIAWVFIGYFILVIQIFSKLPFPPLIINNISTLHVLGYYILLVMVILILNNRSRVTAYFKLTFSQTTRFLNNGASKIPMAGKKWSFLSLLLLAALVWSFVVNSQDDKLHVNFLDVGQGDAILVQTPNHRNILIDGGPSPQSINLELGKKLPFWDRTIDLMILTQPQSDHVTGLVEVLNNFKVKQVIGPLTSNESFIYSQWLKTIQSTNVRYDTAHAGQTIQLGNNLSVEVLHPPTNLFQDSKEDINNNSIILRLNYDKISFLFTADVTEEVELYLISQRANLRSTVLKVAHHGSLTSTSPGMLAVVNPEVAVVSVGNNNHFNHPHPEVIERLNQRLGENRLFLTSKRGTIQLQTDGQKIWVQTDR
jgi:competence protein ComEC